MVSDIKSLIRFIYIKKVPSYGNSFFFLIGVYLLELFGVLGITGMIMLIFGPYWWDLTGIGTFIRSIHMWAAEGFVTLMFIHLFVNFSTSAFKKKRLMWMIGSIMLMLVLLQFAFGIGLRGDFVSQWNDKAGADLWNGMGLGYWINPINAGAVMGWHVAVIPILLIMLMATHYLIVRVKGTNKPYREDVPYSMVAADHRAMYKQMAYILGIVLVFAFIFRAPYVPPMTISGVANSNSSLVSLTLLNEFNANSSTATYMDTIDPYAFSTREVFVTQPYGRYLNLTHSRNYEAEFLDEPASEQNITMKQAYSYFSSNGSIQAGVNSTNPAIVMASQLTMMAQDGIYEPLLQSEVKSGLNTTYVIMFINDTGAFGREAKKYGLTVPQWGMLQTGDTPYWKMQYWLIPYNLLEITTTGIPWWGDLENGIVAMFSFALLLLLPFIPGLRDIPDRIGLYKLFWKTKARGGKRH
jgi:hypothetical protein